MATTTVVLDDDELQRIYTWVDEVPLSRPKRNITRDFSDGVLMAEVVHHFFPKIVEMHNYSAANSIRQKMYNWATLNNKVFKRLSFEVSKPDVESIVNCKPGVIEAVILRLQNRITEMRARKIEPTAAAFPSGGSAEAAGSSSSAIPPYDASYGQQQQYGGAGAPAMAGGAAGRPGFAYPSPHGDAGASAAAVQAAVAAAVAERDGTIGELKETIEILELKIKKLEQLVRLKDSRIQTLTARLAGGPGAGAGPQ